MTRGLIDANTVRAAIRDLVRRHRCFIMKIATEDEALTQAKVRRRVRLFAPLLPVELKIGGPGARGDMELARQLSLTHLIAPMVESAYAARDLVNGVKEIFPERKRPVIGVNIETATAIRNLAGIFAAGADIIKQVTVGRSDLSKSMECEVNSPAVMAATRRVIAAAKRRGYKTFVGGGIDPRNVQRVVRLCAPDCVNTRNFGFRLRDFRGSESLAAAIRHALAAEILLTAFDGGRLAAGRIAALARRFQPEDHRRLPAALRVRLRRLMEADTC